MQTTSLSKLIDSYRLFLIDAYGVLVTSQGCLPGSQELILTLTEKNIPYFIVTNDASRLPEAAAAFYKRSGLTIPVEKVLTAGLAIGEAFNRYSFSSPKCVVLGTEDTCEYVRRFGGQIMDIHDDAEFDAVVIGDDSGFDVIPTLNAVLSSLHQQILRGRFPKLFLANPDLLYPRGAGRFGFTSGSLAQLIEIALNQLHPHLGLKFEVLGKPSLLLFEMAMRRSGHGPHETVMLGDQLHTDIKGANQAGIASTLVASGITQLPLPADLPAAHRPRWILENLL